MKDQLARTLVRGAAGVPTPWGKFDTLVALRPKTLVNVFSAPGVGKSMWALNLAYRVNVPVVYITIDTPLATQALRTWALLGEKPISDVEKRPQEHMRRANRRRNGSRVEWCDTPMKVPEVRDLMAGVTEFLGQPPRILIVDVIGDLLKDRSYEEFNSAFAYMKRIAHDFRCTVVTLHHAQKNNDADEPLFLRDVEYAGDKQPDVVIGMHSPNKRTMVAAILKNRTGPSRADGTVRVNFKVVFRKARVEEKS